MWEKKAEMLLNGLLALLGIIIKLIVEKLANKIMERRKITHKGNKTDRHGD